MAFAIAGPSTILASIVFHCAPNAADPSGVIRLTTCAGGSDGGICGRGGGVGAAAGGAGPCVVDIDAIIIWTATSATYPASLPRLLLCIFLSFFSRSAISQSASQIDARLWMRWILRNLPGVLWAQVTIAGMTMKHALSQPSRGL